MKFKYVLSAVTAAVALASGSAHAVTVSGVQWDPNSNFDFEAKSNIVQSAVSTIGDTISGIGLVTEVNGTARSTYCPSGCQLTIEFGGYTLLDLNPTDIDPDGAGPLVGASYGISPTGQYAFTGGWMNVWLDSSTIVADSSGLTFARATDGVLWLSLLAVDVSGSNSGTTLAGNLGPSFQGFNGTGLGFFDVIGGLAAAYLNTDGAFNNRDFEFSASFEPLNSPQDGYGFSGSGEISGDSIDVPEPGVLALLGLGFAGLGFARRNKKQI